MEQDRKFDLEALRPVEYISEPDFRNTIYVVFDEKGRRPYEIADHYRAIDQIKLQTGVPESILVQFETVKNLYLYAWFIYRFYPVAEHQAYACLELALRLRYEKEIPKKYFAGEKKPGLSALLRYACDRGHIKNEGFRRWREAVDRRTEDRYEIEKLDKMNKKGLKSIGLDYSEIQITDTDKDLDYVKVLRDTLPYLRNHYAHGTTMLHNQVLGTIELVSGVINQIYPLGASIDS